MQALIIKILDDIRGSWRFRWLGLAAAWAVCLIGWMYVFAMPNVYEAKARVYVDSQTVLGPLLRGLALDPNVESELSVVRQALLSRPSLETVARKTDYWRAMLGGIILLLVLLFPQGSAGFAKQLFDRRRKVAQQETDASDLA